MCYQEIKDFKDPYVVPEEKISDTAARIASKYFHRGSQKEVNVSSYALEAIEKDLVRDSVSRKTFDMALNEISPLVMDQIGKIRGEKKLEFYTMLVQDERANSPLYKDS